MVTLDGCLYRKRSSEQGSDCCSFVDERTDGRTRQVVEKTFLEMSKSQFSLESLTNENSFPQPFTNDFSTLSQTFFLNRPSGLFFVYFCLFKQTLEILKQIYAKKIRPVCDAGIRTQNLQYMSMLP